MNRHAIYKKSGFITLLLVVLLAPLKAVTLSDVNIKREREFTGTALYGFMNGGSDLFLEYGFQSLRVIELVYQNEEYTVEIYKMPTPEDAFGIYSLHTFKCLQADSIRYFDCLSAYQLQAAIGNTYFSIVFPSGSKKAKAGAEELLVFYTDKTNNDSPILPDVIKKLVPPYSGVIKYLKGELAIANAYPVLWSLFEGFKDYRIWLIKRSPRLPVEALVTFALPEESERFAEKNNHQKITEKYSIQIDKQDEHSILLKEIPF